MSWTQLPSFDTLLRLVELYRDHKNKDKRLAAAVLHGVRKTIQDWYSCINNNVSPVIPRLIREDKSVIMADLSQFLYDGRCRRAAEDSIKFLKNLRSDGRFKKMNLDVETITKVIDEIGSFEGKVFEKANWVKEKKAPKEQARDSKSGCWIYLRDKRK
jgi:hypothetical protein